MPLTTNDLREIASLLDEAAERGAKKALESVGLHDENAGKDIRDLRSLMDAWRGTKSVAGRTAVQWVTTGLLAAMLLFVWAKFGLKPGD